MLRSTTRLLHHAEWFCSFHKVRFNLNTAGVLYSTFDKEFPNPSLPTPASKLHSHDTDILLEQIKKAKTLQRLLELASMHLDVMNTKHVVQSIQNIHGFKNPHFNNELLLEDKIFQGLCSRLMKTIRLLDPNEIITVYKVLSGLGIRNNTYVMQSILKMMGTHLNNMTLGQLTFLNFLLSKQKPNSLVDGLTLALPLVLQVQIEQQLDSDNINEIVDCLQLACKSRLKPSIIEKILLALLQKAKFLSANNALNIAFSLLNLETPVDGYKQLITYSFEMLSKNVESMTQKQTIHLIRLCRNKGYYNGQFLFAIAGKIIAEKWNFEQTYEVNSCLYKFNFAPQNLMDYFVNVMCSEADILRSTSFYSPLNCVEYLTATGYKPPHVLEALQVLCSCEDSISRLERKSPNLLIKFVSCLTMLGYFPQKYLEQILDSEYLFEAHALSRKQGRSNDFEFNVSSLFWSLQVYNKEDKFEFPPPVLRKLVTTLGQSYVDFENLLGNFIIHGLGGSHFLQNCVFTKDGILIDHVLAMRSGNYPVSLHSSELSNTNCETPEKKFVEDIILPEDSKIVAVIVAQKDQYCRDPEILKGWVDIKIRCLKKKKYYPVVINYENFQNMPDREKIPFLMHEIKHAVEEESITKTNSWS